MALSVEYGKRQSALVSHISTEKVIYCQLDTAEAYDLPNLSEKIERLIENDRKHPLLEVGVKCFAQSCADELWYRGLIINVSATTVTVYYVDYGNSETISLENVCAAGEDLFQSAYQAVQCVLSDFMTNSPSVASVLEEMILNEEIQVTFVSLCFDRSATVGFIPCYNVALYLTAESEITISSALVEKELGQFRLCNSNVQVGEKYRCYLSFDDSPGKFWIQLSYQYDDLLALMEELNEPSTVQALKPLTLASIVPGAVCCCLYAEDGRYYRAEVVNVDKVASICYVDYGNFSTTKLTDVKALPAHLSVRPPFAVQCCLKGIKPVKLAKPHPKLGNIAWTKEVCEKFKSLVDGVELEVTIEEEISAEIFSVFMVETSKHQDIGQMLCNMKCAELASSSIQASPSKVLPEDPTTPLFYTDIALAVRKSYKNLSISYAESPSVVWCHPSQDVTAFEALVDDLNQKGSKFPPPDKVEVNHPCCVQYSLDQSWCRGCVQEVDNLQKLADVLYVDYGNVSSIQWRDIKALPSQYISLPAQAVSFSLAGIVPSSGDAWSDEAVQYFKELVTGRQLNCKTVGLDDDGYPSAILFDPLKKNKKISLELVELGYAVTHQAQGGGDRERSASQFSSSTSQSYTGSPRVSQRDRRDPSADKSSRNTSIVSRSSSSRSSPGLCTIDLRVEQKLDGLVSHVDFPNKFYVQPIEAADNLKQLMQKSVAYSKSAKPCPVNSLRINMPVLAEFLGDGSWYRAIVKGIPGKGKCLVTFVDYGNCEEVSSSKLLELPSDLMQLPIQSIPCSLFGLKSTHTFPKQFVNAFGEMIMEKKFHVLVKNLERQDQLHYNVILESMAGQNVAEELCKASFTDFFDKSSFSSLTQVNVPLQQLPVNKEVEVVMSFVNDPSSFFVQLAESSDVLAKLSDQLNTFYSSGEGKPLENVRTGDFCAAQFSEDGLWYRAMVNQVDGSNITISYIDFGNSEQVKQSSLKVLTNDLAKNPCFAVACTLFEVKESTVSSDAILEKFFLLADRRLQVVFQNNVNSYKNIVPVKLFEVSQSGEKIDICKDLYGSTITSSGSTIESCVSAIDSCVPPLDTLVDCYISFVANPKEVYCQLQSEYEEFQSMMDELNTFYGDNRDGAPLQCTTVGSLCAVLFTDERWYRGKVVAISPSKATVHYFDYGNTEEVDVCDIRALESKFCGLRAQAIKCCLSDLVPSSGSEWNSESIEALQAYVEALVQICFLSKDKSGGYSIQVFVEETDISSDLIKKNLAKSKKVARYREPVMTIDPFPVQIDTTYHVIVTYIVSPNELYCQVIDPDEKLDVLRENIATHCSRATGVSNKQWQPGEFGLGLFSEDKSWYRCVITGTEENGNKLDVFYLDYGNSEKINRKFLLPISQDFCSLPSQAIKCSLKGAKQYKLSAEANENFSQLLLNDEFNMACVSMAEDNICTVELFGVEDTTNIMTIAANKSIIPNMSGSNPSLLGSNQLPVFTFPLGISVDSFHDVLVVYAESPSHFFCHFLVDDQESGVEMMCELQNLYANSSGKQVNRDSCNPGDCVAAQFSDDSLWYRALVLSVEGNSAKVVFLDYGNEDTVDFNDIRELATQFSCVPALAVPCSLAEISPINKIKWSDEAMTAFNELCLEKPCVAQIKARTDMSGKTFKFGDSQVLTVSLISSEESRSIAEELINSDYGVSSVIVASTESSFLQPKLHPGEIHSVYISCVESPSKFWVQFSDEDALAAIRDNLGIVYSDNPAKLPVIQEELPGTSCSAKFSEDGQWYRGIITNVDSTGMTVSFVDYGNSEVVSPGDVRVLQSELLAWEVQAICCSLANFNPVNGGEWDGSAGQVFREITASKLLQMHIVAGQKNDTWTVQLEDEGINVCDLLLQSGIKTAESTQHPPQAAPSITKVDLDVGKKYPAYIAFIDSPSNFYCHLTVGNDQLESLMARVADFYNGNVLEPLLEEGAYCVAQYSRNCAWYRAQILSIHSEMVLVYFIDYGNSELVATSEVMALAAQFAELPAQAITCSLTENIEVPLSEDVVARFNEYDLNLEYSIKVVSRASEGQYVVELFDSSESLINDFVFNPKLSVPPQAVFEYQHSLDHRTEDVTPVELSPSNKDYQNLLYNPREIIDAYVSCVNSPTSFFCQPLQLSGELDDMMAELSSFMADNESIHLPKERFRSGTICLGRFTEDNEWYRAIIEEVISGNNALVSYVDYGNKEVLSSDRIADMPPQFANLSLQAFHCSLFDLSVSDITWNIDQVENFRALVPDTDQINVTVDQYNEVSGQYQVTITKNGQPLDVSFLLQQEAIVKEKSLIVDNVDSSQPYQSESVNVSVVAQKGSARGSGSENGETDSDDESEGKPLIKGPFKLSLAVQEMLEVTVVYIEDPSLIYIQRADCETELQQLCDEIAQYCSSIEGGQPVRQVFCEGDFVLAKWSEDGVWYRGEVLGVDTASEERSSQISFIDYGNIEVIPSDSLVMCPQNFLELPAQAISCCLAQVPHRDSWPILYRDIINEFVDGKVLKASVVLPGSQGMKPTVKLEDVDTGQDISQYVLDKLQEECDGGSSTVIVEEESETEEDVNNSKEDQEEMKNDDSCQQRTTVPDIDSASDISSTLPVPSVCPLSLPHRDSDVFKVGSVHQAYLVSCYGPRLFFCQFANETEILGEITTKLAEVYEDDQLPLIDPSTIMGGVYVAAQFQEDMAWYRAKIIDISPSGEYEVRYVDYGNSETLPLKFLRHLDQSLASHPEIAVRCCLDGIDSLPEKADFWPAVAEVMKGVIGEEACSVEVVLHDKNGATRVKVSSEQGVDVLTALIASDVCTGSVCNEKKDNEDTCISAEKEGCESDDEIGTIEARTSISAENLESAPPESTSEFTKPVGIIETAKKIAPLTSRADPITGENNEEPLAPVANDALDGTSEISDRSETEEAALPDSSDREVCGTPDTEVSDTIQNSEKEIANVPLCNEREAAETPPSTPDDVPPNSSEEFTDREEMPAFTSETLKLVTEITDDESPQVVSNRTEKDTATLASPEINSMFSQEYLSSNLELKSRHSVRIMGVSSLEEFTCKLLSREKELESLMADISSQGYAVGENDEWSCYSLYPTMPVCCCSRKDNQWYRGQVISKSSRDDTYRVLHVDFGSVDNYSKDRLKYLKKSFADQLPPQIIKCSFPLLLESDVSPGLPSSVDPWELDWPTSCMSHFNKLVKQCEEGQVEVIGTEEKNGLLLYTVRLLIGKIDVREQLVAHLIDVSKCSITEPEGGGSSSRVEVEGSKSHHVNGGQKEEMKTDSDPQDARVEERDVAEQAPSATQCSDDNVNNGDDEEYHPVVDADDEDVEESNIGTEINSTALRYLTRELEPGTKVDLVYQNYADSDVFIFQFYDSVNYLMSLMDAIEKFVASKDCSPVSMQDVTLGQPVLAQYSADENWYRGTVTALFEEVVEVLFVDYNNSERVPVTSIRPMVPEFMTLCKQAVFCQLQDTSGIMTSWSSEMLGNLGKLVKEAEFFTASVVEYSDHQLVVSFVEDCPKWKEYFNN